LVADRSRNMAISSLDATRGALAVVRDAIERRKKAFANPEIQKDLEYIKKIGVSSQVIEQLGQGVMPTEFQQMIDAEKNINILDEEKLREYLAGQVS